MQFFRWESFLYHSCLIWYLICFALILFHFWTSISSAVVSVPLVLILFIASSDFSIRGIKIHLDSQFCLKRSFSSEILQEFFWYFDFVWFKLYVPCSICLNLLLVFELSAFQQTWTFFLVELSVWLMTFCLVQLSVCLNFLSSWRPSVWLSFLFSSTFCLVDDLLSDSTFCMIELSV